MKLIYKISLASVAILLFGICGCSSNETNLNAEVNAGEDQKVLVGDTVQLDGISSSGVADATWKFVSKPSGSQSVISNEYTLSPIFTPDQGGEYVVKLSINDGQKTDTVKIQAKYVIAVISNTETSSIRNRTRFGMDELVVDLKDPDAILTAQNSKGSVKTYKWEQISGPPATVSGKNSLVDLLFMAPAMKDFVTSASDTYKWQPLPVSKNDTQMLFRLTVKDAEGHQDSTVQVVYLEDAGVEIINSSGLPNVGVNEVVYLSGPSLKAIWDLPSIAVTDWDWRLARPTGSSSVFDDTGSLTSALQIPKFIPDVSGIYTVTYSSVTGGSGTIQINAATYVGVGTVAGSTPSSSQCGKCHDRKPEADKISGWKKTRHADAFNYNFAAFWETSFNTSSLFYQTVGFNPLAPNNGFDDLLQNTNISDTDSISDFDHFSKTYPNLAKLTGIQCENCHGPGGEHSGDKNKISKSFSQTGVCGQCHIQRDQWVNSGHNSTGVINNIGTYQELWPGYYRCIRCHTSYGFQAYLKDGTNGSVDAVSLEEPSKFVGISCAGCHDSHNETNPSQLRLYGKTTMEGANAAVVNAGKAAVCYSCHSGTIGEGYHCDPELDGAENGDCTDPYSVAIQTPRQIHFNPQALVFEGKGAVTDLDGADSDPYATFTLSENSFHSGSGFVLSKVTGDTTLASENNKCVTCHMSPGPNMDQHGYNKLGAHSLNMRSKISDNILKGGDAQSYASTDVELVSACRPCHVSAEKLNLDARADYDGDGNREGVQDEVKGLLLNLSKKILAVDAVQSSNPLNLVQEDLSNPVCSQWIHNGAYLDTCSTSETFNQIVPKEFSWEGIPLPGGDTCLVIPPGNWDFYTACNFLQSDNPIKSAIYNYHLVYRDKSLGIHNLAFDIQLLQKTYSAISKMYPTAGPAGTENKTFAQAFPLATIR